jgi:hypothetical protein
MHVMQVVYPYVLMRMGTFDVAQYSVMGELLGNTTFWLVIVAVYLAVFGHRYAERAFVWLFNPQVAPRFVAEWGFVQILPGFARFLCYEPVFSCHQHPGGIPTVPS